jgi:hypothetical protein
MIIISDILNELGKIDLISFLIGALIVVLVVVIIKAIKEYKLSKEYTLEELKNRTFRINKYLKLANLETLALNKALREIESKEG